MAGAEGAIVDDDMLNRAALHVREPLPFCKRESEIGRHGVRTQFHEYVGHNAPKAHRESCAPLLFKHTFKTTTVYRSLSE